MGKSVKWRALAAGVGAALLWFSSTGAEQSIPAPDYVPGEVIVKYHPSADASSRNAVAASHAARLVHRFEAVAIDHLRLPAGANVEATVAALHGRANVQYAQPNYVRRIVASGPPNDPFWLNNSLWGMQRIQVQSVWNNWGSGSADVVIANIDTGVNYSHPDLAPNMWRNPAEIPGNFFDDDGNGYVDDVYGIDTVNNDTDPMDDHGHGTHTAGTNAAAGNNGIGVAGVSWNAKILACKFLSASGSGSDAGAIACFNYITGMKQRGVNIRVSSNSWGGPRGGWFPTALRNAIDAAGNAGIVNVFAAGNSGANSDVTPFDPAALTSPSIVSVAASDSSDNRAGFSNYGATSVDLAAPGVSIVSTYGSSGYGSSSGTSMAAPHVAGAAVLLAALQPELTGAAIKAALLENTDVLPQWGGLVLTGGRLNVFKAVSAVMNNTPPAVSLTSPLSGAVLTAPATIQVAADASDADGISAVAFYQNGTLIGTDTTSPYSVTWSNVGAGAYTLTAIATDAREATTTSNSVVVTVDPPAAPATAVFVRSDASTRGNWLGTYGEDGYRLAGDGNVSPPYGSVTPAGAASWTWASSTSDPRALQSASGIGRLAATWYGSTISFDVNLTDGQAHDVAFYMIDWDSPGRVQRFDLLDAATQQVLDTRTVDGFTGGKYLVWTLTGRVTVRVTRTAGANAVVSAVFFGANPPNPGAGPGATFVGVDTTTQGNWISAYGADGYRLANDSASLPAYAALTPLSASQHTWTTSTSESRALRRASGNGRFAAAWYGSVFSFDVNLTDGQPHQVALYLVDWDSSSRGQRFDILDAATQAVLDTRTVSGFNGGRYVVWTLTGHVTIRVTRTAGSNAVVSAVFFDPEGSTGTPASASFLGTDATTRGNWVGVYGGQGYGLAGDTASAPAFAVLTPEGAASHTWSVSTSDARALQRPAGGRIAAAWFGAAFSLHVQLTDGQAHEIALYLLDWDSASRGQRIEILDASTGQVLDARDVSGFNGGKYAIWSVTGNITIRITRLSGSNAVVSGVFFDGATQ